MNTKPFFMSPPNDHVNNFDSETLIDEVRSPVSGKRICSGPEESYADILDGRLFSQLLRSSQSVSSTLEQLVNNGYSLLVRRKLQSEVLKVFNSQYKQSVIKEREDFISSFLTDHPGYEGHIAPPPSDEDIKQASLKVQKYVVLISEWCMADYSTSILMGDSPDTRNWSIDSDRLKALEHITFDKVYETVKLKEEAKPKPAVKLPPPPPTPEELIQRKLNRELANMKRAGKLSSYAKEMLECSHLLK